MLRIAVATLLCLATTGLARADAAPEPPPSPSVILKGEVAVLLPDGFVIRSTEGHTLIETRCPAWTLGLERGDTVRIFGGMGDRGIAPA